MICVLDFVKQLRGASRKSDRLMHVLGGNAVIAVEPKRGDKPFCVENYSGELNAVLQQAFADGYIFLYDDGTFRLTYKGIHPYRETASQVSIYILKSVLVPLVVSAITALVVSKLSMP